MKSEYRIWRKQKPYRTYLVLLSVRCVCRNGLPCSEGEAVVVVVVVVSEVGRISGGS